MKSIPNQLPIDQSQLDQLLITNKSLAVQKRELHRQKLRVYSQKAVKIRCLIRQTSDPEQKRCLQSKLKALQQKQDSQITKLAKIDQIQKEIDQFITEQNEEGVQPQRIQTKESKYQKWRNEVENTPAERLRTKSSMPYKAFVDSNADNKVDFSRKKSSFYKQHQQQQMLLKDSRQVLHELQANNFSKSVVQQKQKSRNSIKLKQPIGQFSSYKKSQVDLLQFSRQRFGCNQEDGNQQFKNISLQGVPTIFVGFVEKVSKFWPNDIQELVQYFKESEFVRKKMSQKQKDYDTLPQRLEQLRQDEERLRQSQQRLRSHEQHLSDSIQQQRRLMQRIDRLQQQHNAIKKQTDSSLHAIAKSAELIARSSLAIGEHNDPIKINCFHSDSVHQFSVDSFESSPDSSLLQELAKFEKGIHQYLLAAERAVMLVSGELQQISLKLGKSKEEQSQLDSKKRQVQQELAKIDQSLLNRKGLLKQLQGGVSRLQQTVLQSNSTAELKRALGQQLEQKCEKLRLKKKSLTERVKRLQQDLQSIAQQKESSMQESEQLEQNLTNMRVFEKQLETKLIFYERDIESRLRDLQLLEKKEAELMVRVQQINRSNEQMAHRLSEQQIKLAEIQAVIQIKHEQEGVLGERARKLQQQLADTSVFIQQQKVVAQQQAQQVTIKSAQHLDIQTKLSQALDSLRQHQAECAGWESKIADQMEKVKKGNQQLGQIEQAKNDLQSILHDVIMKKEVLITEVNDRSKQLEALLTSLEGAQQDYQLITQRLKEMYEQIDKKQGDIKDLQAQVQQLRNELDQQLQQQSNIVGRLAKLKQIQKSILLGIGVRGTSGILQGQMKARVAEAVGQLATLNDIKSQLKECKYENRKLRLDNQRLNKLLEGGQTY